MRVGSFALPTSTGSTEEPIRKGNPSLTPHQVQAIREKDGFGRWTQSSQYWARTLVISTDWVRKIRRRECYIWVPDEGDPPLTGADKLLDELLTNGDDE